MRVAAALPYKFILPAAAELPPLPLRALADLCERTPPFEVEISLEQGREAVTDDPYIVESVTYTPTLRSSVYGVIYLDELREPAREDMVAILYARPGWRWRFKLGVSDFNVTALYTCECAAREVLRAWASFPLSQLGNAEVVGPACQNFYRAHERNIEAHTATWREWRLPEEAAAGEQPHHCRRCRRALQFRSSSSLLGAITEPLRAYVAVPAVVWKRTPGVLPPGRPTTPPVYYCRPCGARARAEH